MLHRMPKPGDVIQHRTAQYRVLFVLSSFDEKIDKKLHEDNSYCRIKALTPNGTKIEVVVIFYDNWIFFIDSEVSDRTNKTEE